ncbi:DUF1656 domain-containing protein [Caulobacter sp. 602-1]|uniref:DUF1656 domain-containing protein n=1 Tax=Caulobacter sp. 602-1 TaxID=2492472 RepID=UPI000F636B4B|nr:DUF1656 domain-containing protein [Caulobacter sp. 602-1]RRN63861.1 DUF1656 domain-containing protein [Caulobacter sp. 602-1]
MKAGWILGDVIVSPLPLSVGLGLAASLALSAALARLGAYRWLWRRPLVELSLFCVLVAAFDTALSGHWRP